LLDAAPSSSLAATDTLSAATAEARRMYLNIVKELRAARI
jgi:hypothetical protein